MWFSGRKTSFALSTSLVNNLRSETSETLLAQALKYLQALQNFRLKTSLWKHARRDPVKVGNLVSLIPRNYCSKNWLLPCQCHSTIADKEFIRSAFVQSFLLEKGIITIAVWTMISNPLKNFYRIKHQLRSIALSLRVSFTGISSPDQLIPKAAHNH